MLPAQPGATKMKTEILFSLKLSQLELAVHLGRLTPQQAIEEACAFANMLGLPESITDTLKAQPPVLEGGAQ